MNELLTQIQDVYAAFSTDAALQIEKNNKTGGAAKFQTGVCMEER